MTSPMKTQQQYAVAVIKVCLDVEIQKVFALAMDTLHWEVTPITFDTYISADRRPSLPQQAKTADLRIALVDFDESQEQAAESTRYLKQMFQGAITVIAVGKAHDTDLLLSAMRAGCSEFLQKPVAESSVLETLRRLQIADVSSAVVPVTEGEVLTFVGAKGGVGTTTIAVHLAMYLVQCHQKKVLLVDNHDDLGHVCVYLGLDGAHFQFQDVVQNVSRLDSELLRGYVARHTSGLDVLASPDTCTDTLNSDPEALAQTLDFLRGEYDYIVVDSALRYNDVCVSLFERSNHIYITVTPEIGPLRDLTRHLDAIGTTDGALEKLQVVLNRFPSPYSVTEDQIESLIKRPIAVKLANSYQELLRTENLGQPLPSTSKTEFATQIRIWSQSLAGPAKPTSPSKGKKSFFDVLSYKQAAEVRS